MSRYVPGKNVKPFRDGWLPSLPASGSNLAIGMLLACEAVCNLLDLATSRVALQGGLHEGNPLALGLGGSFDLGTLGALTMLKLAFAIGAGLVALVGFRTKNPEVKKLMQSSLMTSALLFLALTCNNLYWILR